MPISSSQEIIPFPFRRFPPHRLQKKAFSSDLHKAQRALGAYADALAQISFPATVLSTLITLESIASLDSQKIKASLKEILRSRLLPAKNGKKLRPIVNYIHALHWGFKNTQLTHEFICTLHKKIKNGFSPKALIGSYRKKQNWIGPFGCTIDEAYFYPPAASSVKPLMQELLHYCKMKRRDPLLQLALIFAQLLIIHPFMDGNGRVARILIPLFLYHKKVIPIPYFFMSGYFKQHRLRYFQNLYQTTEENQWANWIAFFMKGVVIQANQSRRLLKKIENLYSEVNRCPGINRRVLHFLFQYPVFSFAFFKKAGGSKRLLASLQHSKWVGEDKEGMYIFTPVLKILQKHQK